MTDTTNHTRINSMNPMPNSCANYSRPSFAATVVKKSRKISKLGLQFGAKPLPTDNAQYVVILAKVSGAFGKKTYLVPGLQVLSINQTLVKTPEEALAACENTQVGHIVSVEVAGYLYKASKKKQKTGKSTLFFGFGKSKSQKVGISIKQVDIISPEEDHIIVGDDEPSGQTVIQITQVERDGLFPKLRVGSILHGVNGQVATSFKKTLGWLKNSKQLTLIVLDPPKPHHHTMPWEDTTTDAPISTSTELREPTSKDRFPTTLGLVESNPPVLVNSSSSNTVPTTTKIDPRGIINNDRLRVIACIVRPSLKIPLGLTFGPDSDGGVLILNVEEKGIFAHTGLEANQKIVRINGHLYPASSEAPQGQFDHVINLLRQATGRVTIEAVSVDPPLSFANTQPIIRERQIFSIQKSKKSLQLDVGLDENVQESCVQISKVSHTLEKVLGIKNGVQLKYVNGKPCNPKDIATVRQQMDAAFPILSLECIANVETQPTQDHPSAATKIVRVVACIIRPSVSVDLGLTFRRDISSGCLIIDTVASDGLFAHTGVRPYQKIVKINGHPYQHISALKLTQAIQLLQESKGRLTIEAETVATSNLISSPFAAPIMQQDSSNRIDANIFSIQKAKRSFQLGLGLQQIKSPGRPSSIIIYRVSPILEKVLGLKKGLELLRINGVACDANNIPRVHSQMDSAFPMLSLECQDGPATSTESPRISRLTVNSSLPISKPVEEKKNDDQDDDDDEAWMAQEYAMAEGALPIGVTMDNKKTAKIVRTVVVEIPKNKLVGRSVSIDRLLGLTLAKHRYLNAVVITHMTDESLISNQLAVGQVIVSINHISCPLTTDSTFKMLRRKSKEGPLLRIEAGDVEHVVDPDGFGHKQCFRSSQPKPSSTSHKRNHLSAEEEDEAKRMMEAIRMGMLKATDEELKEEYDISGPVISDDMELDDIVIMPKIHMEGLPPELFPNSKIHTTTSPKAGAIPKQAQKRKKDPKYYQDEDPETFSA